MTESNMYMCVIVIVSIAFLILSVNGIENDACTGYFDRYGGIRSNPNRNNCVFRCDGSSSTISLQSVTFEQIKNSCDNVKIAASLGYCSNLNDLIWTTSSLYNNNHGCLCPYCKCISFNSTDTDIDENELITLEDTYSNNNNNVSGEFKTCINSTCVQHPYDSNVIDLVHVFKTINKVYDNQTFIWKEYSCPPVYCKNHFDVDYIAGSIWLEGDFDGVDGEWGAGYCQNNGSISYIKLGNLNTGECSYYLEGSIPRPTGICTYDEFYSSRTGYTNADSKMYVCYNEQKIAVNTYDSTSCNSYLIESNSVQTLSNDGTGSKCVYGFKWNSYTNTASYEEIKCDYVSTERKWLTSSTIKNEETTAIAVNQCINGIMYGCNSTRYWKETYFGNECKKENIQTIQFYANVHRCTKKTNATDINKYVLTNNNSRSKPIMTLLILYLFCFIFVWV